jgi:hypothetical protein
MDPPTHPFEETSFMDGPLQLLAFLECGIFFAAFIVELVKL